MGVHKGIHPVGDKRMLKKNLIGTILNAAVETARGEVVEELKDGGIMAEVVPKREALSPLFTSRYPPSNQKRREKRRAKR